MTTLYFAYGSNLDLEEMEKRCPSSTLLSAALLDDWSFIINGQGWATIVPDAGGRVFGALWRLQADDERSLDGYEDVGGGLYSKERLKISEPEVVAMTYLAANSRKGLPNEGYLERIVRALQKLGAPQAYTLEISRWAPDEPFDVESSVHRGDNRNDPSVAGVEGVIFK